MEQNKRKKLTQKAEATLHRAGLFFSPHQISVAPALTDAIKRTGQAYNEIGELFAQQPKLDSEPLVDSLALFKGILSNIPDTITLQKASRQKVAETQKMQDEGKMASSEQQQLQHRADVLSYAVMAEMNNFQNERRYQIKTSVQSYLDQQILFYQKIVDHLQAARAKYDEI